MPTDPHAPQPAPQHLPIPVVAHPGDPNSGFIATCLAGDFNDNTVHPTAEAAEAAVAGHVAHERAA